MAFNKDVMKIDSEKEADRICHFLKEYLHEYKKEGYIVGLSGGIDSALTLSLCVKALGRNNVFGVILPEKDSNPLSERLAREHAGSLGIEYVVEDITSVLEAFGTYRKRDDVIRKLFPAYGSDHRIRLYLPENILEKDSINFFSLDIMEGDDIVFSTRLRRKDTQIILAATDTKQRTRMMHLYYHAESMNYAVCGTTNRTELIQGYFVKYGDGGVDIEPLAHLYKTQVYSLSRHLGVHKGIIERPPSPDTFNSHMSDEEFFFRMPYDKLDMLLNAWERKITSEEVSSVMGLKTEQVERAFRDFERKHIASRNLRILPPNIM